MKTLAIICLGIILFVFGTGIVKDLKNNKTKDLWYIIGSIVALALIIIPLIYIVTE